MSLLLFLYKEFKNPTDIKEQGKSKSTLSCMLHTMLQFASKNLLKDEFSQFLQSFRHQRENTARNSCHVELLTKKKIKFTQNAFQVF